MTSRTFQSSQKIEDDGVLRISLIGPLNGTSRLPRAKRDGAVAISIDLSQVEYVSSEGVRAWFNWVKEIEREFAGTPIAFEKCSTSIMGQSMSVYGFIPAGAEVRSYFVPFFCNECEASSSHLFPTDGRPRSFEEAVPEIAKLTPLCPFCSSPTELDALPERYLTALRQPK